MTSGYGVIRAACLLWAAALISCRAESPPRELAEAEHTFDLLRPGDAVVADSLIAEGEAAYFRSEYDSARTFLERGGGGAASKRDSAAYARALTWLGLTAWRQGRYKDARSLGEQGLKLKTRLGLKEDLFRSYNALGLLAHNEGRFADASRLFLSGADAARAVNDSVSLAKAIGNLGLVYADVGEFDKSRNAFLTLRQSASGANDTRAEGNALSNLGMLEIRSGDPAAALRWLTAARALYRRAEYPAGEEAALGQTGSAYDAMGDAEKALAYLDSALVLAEKHDLTQPQADNLQIIGELLGEAGDHQKGLDYLRRARIVAASAGLQSRLGDIARAEAREYASLLRFDMALGRAREAAAAHKTSGASLEELNDQLLYAEIAQLSGRSADANAALEIANVLSRKLGSEIARVSVVFGRARIADASGHSSEVLDLLEGREADVSRLGADAAWEMHAMRARAHARRGEWSKAVTEGRAALDGVEHARRRIPEGPMRAAYAGDKSEVYAGLVYALLKVGKSSEAFEVADAGRGRALLERIGTMGRDAARQSSRELAESERFLRKIDWLVERLRQVDTVPPRERSVAMRSDLADLSGKLVTARRDYEDRLRRVRTADPRGIAILGASGTSAREVQSALAPREVLIEYLASRDRLMTFIVTPNQIQYLEAPISLEDLGTRVRLASRLVSSRGSGSQSTESLKALHELLVMPVQRSGILDTADDLVIVPPAVLSALPFAALIDSRGRYLVERHSLLTLSSAAALPALRSRRQTRSPEGQTVLAPFPRELPSSAVEAKAVRRESPRAVVYLGSTATEPALRIALDNASMVHIASHAVLNHVSPMFSRVELASPVRREPRNDGRLEVHELLDLPVRSDLVFLSGCETGAGTAWATSFKRNPDYSTLAQAFLYSGARDVIGTLWRIDDHGASVFAARFYSALEGRSTASALAAAQREMIRDNRYSAPRYWAAYTLSGSGLQIGRAKRLASDR